MEEVKDPVIVVEEPQADVPVGDELSPMEVELAKKHSIDVGVKDEVKDGVKSEVKPKVEDKATPKAEIPVEELDSFEKLHDLYQSNFDKFSILPKNIRNLYHSQKGLYKRMKDEEEKRKKVEDDAGKGKLDNAVARIRLDKIKQRLANPEGLTVEELQELIEDKREIEGDENKPLTRKDLEAIEEAKKREAEEVAENDRAKQAQQAEMVKRAEAYAKENINDLTAGKYTNFDDVVALAQEMSRSKKIYAKQIAEAFNGEMTESEIIEVIVDIARINPKWGEKATPEKGKKADDVDKLVKNASKQQTSAVLSGGRGTREIHISEDMDPEEAARVWDKIPRDMRHKILSKIH